MSLLDNAGQHVNQWPPDAQVKALGEFQWANWLERARPEQRPPEGDWRVWYMMGGRGSGKTRAGAETLAHWEHQHPGWYAAVAPTFADAKDVCAEDPESGLIAVLGNRVDTYNRSLGEIFLKSGSRISLDGADDGALRIQGRNLSGVWCIAKGELVITGRGAIPIEDVRVGDVAATREAWRPVTAAVLTHRDAKVVKITTEHGTSLRCTPDHQVWVEDQGWTEARQVTVGDKLHLWKHWPDLQRGTNGQNNAGTETGRATTKTGLVSSCTQWFGNARTALASLTEWLSTTSTTTEATTIPTISKQCLDQITLTSMDYWVAHTRPRRERRSARLKSFLGLTASRDRGSVTNADRSTTPRDSEPGSVLHLAPVPSTVRSIAPDGTSDVYDLTVEGEHEFFANGLLVKNCDEVGLWHASQWDRAWKVSVRLAVRKDPALIVATGTPKMGHPLVALLVADNRIPVSRLRTSDNVANLTPAALEAFYEEYAGTVLGKQELDGEWIMALEGDLLKRAWWKYYPARKNTETDAAFVKRLPTFQMVLVSVDTPLKDKESGDFVAIQVWGVDKANRYLLDARTERMGYDAAKRAVSEMSKWARRMWKCQHRTLIENAGFGVEMIIDLKREIGLVEKISVGAEGNKGQRAFSAASDLETGQCFLPGRPKGDMSGPDETSPAITHSLVEEAALFQMDGSHNSHDDQVDAWSQAMNWLRSRQSRRARTWSSFKQRP